MPVSQRHVSQVFSDMWNIEWGVGGKDMKIKGGLLGIRKGKLGGMTGI
jgi:hypothetical protein